MNGVDEVFLQIVEAMDVSGEIEEMLRDALSRIISASGFEFGCIHVMEGDLIICMNVQEKLARRIKDEFPKEIDRLLDEGEICVLSDFQGIRSVIFIPVLRRGIRIGLIVLGSSPPRGVEKDSCKGYTCFPTQQTTSSTSEDSPWHS